jgi:hypothetical protein
MSDTHPGDFGDPKNIFGNLANRVSDTHKGSQTPAPVCQVLLPVMLWCQVGTSIEEANNGFVGGYSLENRVECGTVICALDNPPLLPERNSFDMYLGDTSGAHDVFDVVLRRIFFEVQAADVFGTGQLPAPQSSPMYWPARLAVHKRHHPRA